MHGRINTGCDTSEQAVKVAQVTVFGHKYTSMAASTAHANDTRSHCDDALYNRLVSGLVWY